MTSPAAKDFVDLEEWKSDAGFILRELSNLSGSWQFLISSLQRREVPAFSLCGLLFNFSQRLFPATLPPSPLGELLYSLSALHETRQTMNASIKRNGLLTLGAVVIAVVSYQAGKSSYSEPEKDLSTSPDPNHFRLRLDARDQASKRWHRQEELKAAFFETRRPFNWDPRPYSFWKILTDCQLPDPAKSAYRECLLVVEAQQVNLANSLTLDSGAGQVVRMVLPGFAERRPKTGAILKKGSIFQCQTFSPEELPEGIFSSQTVDTTESFDLKTLVAMAAHRCESAPQPYIAPVAFETASGISREEVIRNDYNTFKSWLQTRGGNLDAIIKEKAALVPRIKTELENSGGILTRGHLSFTRLPEGSKVSQGWDEQPFSALFSFHKQLAARGIDLIVCPIPEKELLVGPKFFDDPLIDARRYQLYEKTLGGGH